VDFVRRHDADQCVIHWANPTKIYRAKEKFGNGSTFINWAFGVTAYSYNSPTNDKDWARAWKERDRIERGEQPEEVLAPRWKQASVREEEEGRMYCQTRCPSANRSKKRHQRIFRDAGSAGIQDCHSSPLMIDADVVGNTSMEIETVLTDATLVGSPSKGIRTAVNIDDFLGKIVEDSDLAALSVAKAALQRAAQNFMDTVDALAYEHCASAKAESPDVPYSGSFHAGEAPIECPDGAQNSIGLVQSLFRIQRMIEPDLRV
jgi:hypothetical protein